MGPKKQKSRKKAKPLAKLQGNKSQPQQKEKPEALEERQPSSVDEGDDGGFALGHPLHDADDTIRPDGNKSVLSINQLPERPESTNRDTGKEDVVPTAEFKDMALSTSTIGDTAASSISGPSVTASAGSVESSRSKSKAVTSEPASDERLPSPDLDKFVLALQQWAVETGISQSAFEELLDVLGKLKSYDEIASLPESPTTLIRMAHAFKATPKQ